MKSLPKKNTADRLLIVTAVQKGNEDKTLEIRGQVTPHLTPHRMES